MRSSARSLFLAALLAGAAVPPGTAWAGSCCGGGSNVSAVVPRAAKALVDVSFDYEKYDGFWDEDGDVTSDPEGSDLRQYRLTVAAGVRLGPRWQAGLAVPYIWNVNEYADLSSRSDGIGDLSVSVWYEALDEGSAWKVRRAGDLTPSVSLGLSLLVPTGTSPYDDVDTSFDVSGRGFYRLDGNLLVEKTLHPVSASLLLGYGTYFGRSVNREYGREVEPYRKRLGDRTSGSFSLSYIQYLGTRGDALTGTASVSYVQEVDGTIDGERDSSTGFHKTALGGTLAYSGTDHGWGVRAGWTHAIRRDGWGENFPATDIYTLGVRYAFR